MNLENAQTKIKTFFNDTFKFPFYILLHPIKGFEEFKREKKGKLYVALFYLFMMIMSVVVTETMIGFLIKSPWSETFNLGRTALLVIVPIILATIGNWSVTTLLDGKGKMKEIFMTIMYGLIPYIWISIPITLISNFLIREELQLYYAIIAIGAFLSGYKIFMGLLVVHEYTLFKTILTILFTLVAIAVMIFIGLLLLTIFQQVYGFLKSIYEEIILRVR
ncbi:MAG TPA: YIP1 family protein [Acholeplasmataceae bacterium]|jgi:hypothetical protein|nr:YIP1 family protein [Acholeplasmataceae bacterium]HQC30293.1 YIP1 family protein [Acholeplasmataceae bacterium]